MSATLSKIVMVIALSCLNSNRRDWARSMLEGFKSANEYGRPLLFSSGCLLAALREMPNHAEGRMNLARYGVTIGLILPLALVLFTGALAGYPYTNLPDALSSQTFAGGNGTPSAVNDGNRSAVSALTFVVLLLSARHLLVAWFVVESDWQRVAVAQRFGAALIVTLALFTGIIVLEETSLVLPVAAFAIELFATTALSRWHNGAGGEGGGSRAEDDNHYHVE